MGSIHNLLVDGDLVALRLTMTMTHVGEYLGLPPTGRRLEASQMLLDRIAGDRIAASYQEIDALRILTQLGVVPRPGTGPLGLLGWSFGLIGRVTALKAREAVRARRGRP